MSIDDFKEASRKCGSKYGNIWEIKLERCTQSYGQGGEGGCSANPEGTPCRNTYKTCTSKCDFVCENYSYFHTDCTDKCFLNIAPNGYIPDVASFNTVPSKYEFCQGMPGVETQSLKLQDSRGSDYFEDPYRDRRTTSSKESGTRLEKWVQANNLEGRIVNWYYGPCDASFPNSWINRSYFIDSIDGPSGKDCQYTLKLKDPFSLITSDKRTIPAAVSTTNSLVTGSRILSYSDAVSIPGLQEAYESTYFSSTTIPGDFYICIDDKVFKVTQQFANNVDGNIFQILESGVCGSEVLDSDEEIDVGTEVTIAKHWPKGTNIVDIIFDVIFQDGVSIPSLQNFSSSAILSKEIDGDTASGCSCGPFLDNVYDAQSFIEMQQGCASFYFTDEIIICEPTSPKELLNEIAQSYLIAPYIDDCTGLIKLSQITPPSCEDIQDFPVIDECNILSGSLSVSRDRTDRVTEVTLLSRPDTCVEPLSNLNLTNIAYSGASLIVDDDDPFQSLSQCGSASWMLPKRKIVKSRFFRGCNAYQSDLIAGRILELRKETPIQVTFTISGKDLCFSKTDYILINNPLLQNVEGGDTDDIFFVKSIHLIDPKGNCWQIIAESSGFKQTDTWANTMSCEDTCGAIRFTYEDDQNPTANQVKEFFEVFKKETCYVDNVNSDVVITDSGEVTVEYDPDYFDSSSSQVEKLYTYAMGCPSENCKKFW